MSKKIQAKLFITGKLHTITGLHIGGNSGGLKIGGADNTVIRNTLNNQPYIPGSALRGKMRSLLERARGPETENPTEGGYSNTGNTGNAGTDPKSLLGQLFGVSADKNNKEPTPTRLIVRDAFLTDGSVEKLNSASNTDMPMTEVKTEVSIDRISSRANPREIERVPAGAEFDLNFILTLYNESEVTGFLNLFFESLSLIEGDSLGGHGSRGYGRVLFKEFKISQKTSEDYKKNKEEKEKFNTYDIPASFKESLNSEKR